MKSNGQIGHEAYCESVRWFEPNIKKWFRLDSAVKDAWEEAADAITAKVKEEHTARIEELENLIKELEKVIEKREHLRQQGGHMDRTVGS